MTWPTVLTEFDTLLNAVAGTSIGRYGDGELKCAYGRGYRSQEPDERLAAELRAGLLTKSSKFLPCIPTMRPDVSNAPFWEKHRNRFEPLLNPNKVYGSAFVGRSDMAPWIEADPYRELLRKLWRGKRAVVVGHAQTKATRVADDAREVVHVACPKTNAYRMIDELERVTIDHRPDVVIMSCGPTATVLAARLARAGIHAVDLGRGFRLLKEDQ